MKSSREAAMLSKVEEWKNSGLSLKEFALSLGMPRSAFEYWVRKMRATQTRTSGFVELSTESSGVQPCEGFSARQDRIDPHAYMEITFPHGIVVKIYR
jgi:hypothetical protein